MAPDARSNPAASRRRADRALAAVLSAVALLGGLLRVFSPERYGFYPRCPFQVLTGLECPGCGATRALEALLHGHLAAALHWNALIVLLLPALGAYLAAGYGRARAGHPWPRLPQGVIAALLLVAMAFATVRNLV